MKQHLQSVNGAKMINTVSSSAELMSALRTKTYTHLIINIIQVDGNTLEILPNIATLYPKMNIMVYSVHQPIEIYANVLKQHNIQYYLNKIADEETTAKLIDQFIQNIKIKKSNLELPKENPFNRLSSRELEVLHYLIQGVSTKEIAETLNLKMNSISTFKQRIFTKTECTNLKELLQLTKQYHIN